MEELLAKAAKLKQDKPWVFWIFIIPIALIVILAFAKNLITAGAIKDVEKTQAKDDELEAAQKDAERKGNDAEREADKIEEKISELRKEKKENSGKEWYEKDDI